MSLQRLEASPLKEQEVMAVKSMFHMLHMGKPTCKRCPHPPSGHHNLWRWCAVCQIPGESSWHPNRPAYVVCWSFGKTNRKICEDFARVKAHHHCERLKSKAV